MLDVHMMVMLGGRQRTRQHNEALLDAAGFAVNRQIDTASATWRSSKRSRPRGVLDDVVVVALALRLRRPGGSGHQVFEQADGGDGAGRCRANFDKHAAYVVVAFVAGG